VRTAGAKGEAGPRRWLALRHPSSHTAEDAEGEVASLARHAEIMLGVLHYKLEGYNYLQQLYAFQPRAPFEIIALSRPFCWTDQTTSGARLQRRSRTYACPYIEMTMAISPKVDTPERALLSVGMNDCTGRVVEVDLSTLLDEVEMKL